MARKRTPPQHGARRSSIELRVEQAPGGDGWRLLHPRCALERADDITEADSMIAEGESEIAMDELRWLLSGCPDFLHAHRLLGELALAAGDTALARGHFGHGYVAGVSALKRAGNPRPLPQSDPANQDFFACGKGLAWCLNELGKRDKAAEVIGLLLDCDPTDPLGLKQFL